MSVIYKNNLANIYREIVVVLYNNKCVDADKSSQPQSQKCSIVERKLKIILRIVIWKGMS